MTGVAQQADCCAANFSQHRNPFGASAPASEPLQTLTIQDAVRRCRWIAIDINAATFSLIQISTTAERRLIPHFDSSYPEFSEETRLICRSEASAIVRHAKSSTAPCCWGEGPCCSEVPHGFEWCKRLEPLTPGTRGMAFPVHTERRSGIVVFFGPDIQLGPQALFDIHARCFALFEATARIQPDDGEIIPSISKRELECLKLTANGYTSEEIARSLKLSVHTANQYLTNTTQKLNAMNRMHAVAKALRMGLIE